MLNLFRKSSRDYSRRDCDQTYTKQRDNSAEYLPERGDGVDVAIAYSGQRGHCPPQPGKSIVKDFGLNVVLDIVHQYRSNNHEQRDDEH